MRNNDYKTNGTVINVKEAIWELLAQWKAVVLVAVLFMILVQMLLFAGDTKAYNQMLEDKKQAEERANIPPADQIESVLSELPAGDRSIVKRIIQERAFIGAQEEYLNDSIWLNSNPANQRTLSLSYLIKKDDSPDINTIKDAYTTLLEKEEMQNGLRDVLSLDVGLKYIAELVTTSDDSDKNDNTKGDGSVYTVEITLPEDAEADSVQSFVENYVNQCHKELVAKVGEHSITLLDSEEFFKYNSKAIDRMAEIMTRVNTLETSIKNYKNDLNDTQKAALDAVAAINDAAAGINDDIVESSDELIKPGIKSKNILMGFCLGVFLYICIFLLILFLKGRPMTAEDLERCTGIRSLGSINYNKKQAGILALLQSKAVQNARYRGKGDESSQIENVISKLQAVCEHASVNKVTLLRMTCADAESEKITEAIVDGIKSIGIDSEIIDASDHIDEKILLPIRDAVIIAGRDNKMNAICELSELCSVYDIRMLGNLFICRQ